MCVAWWGEGHFKRRLVYGKWNLKFEGPWISPYHHLWTRVANAFDIKNYSIIPTDRTTPAETLSDLIIFTPNHNREIVFNVFHMKVYLKFIFCENNFTLRFHFLF